MSSERGPFRNPRPPQGRCNQIDVKEILKREITTQDPDAIAYLGGMAGGSGGSGSDSGSGVGGSGFEDNIIYFDSLAKDSTSNLSNGEVKFQIPPLNNTQDISNMVEMAVNDSFYFPRVVNTAGKPDFFYYRRVYLQISTLPVVQSVRAANTETFHFEFDVQSLNSQAVQLIPTRQEYYFTRPINSLSDMTMIWSVPILASNGRFRRIPIPQDTVTIQSIPGTNPAQFTIISGPTTSVIAPVGAIVAPGVALYITGYGSGNAAIDNALNSIEGLFTLNILSSTTFEIAGFDFSVVASAPNNVAAFTARMIIPKNRIAFPMRFTSRRSQSTNYITATHQ